MVHIIDTEHPWDVYSVNSGHAEVITCLEWDQSGEPRPRAPSPSLAAGSPSSPRSHALRGCACPHHGFVS